MFFRSLLIITVSILSLNLTACAASPSVIKTGDQQDASPCDDVADRDLRDTCFREELKAARTSIKAAQQDRSKTRAKPPSDSQSPGYNPLLPPGTQSAPPPPTTYVPVGMNPSPNGTCVYGYDIEFENVSNQMIEVQGALPCGRGALLENIPTSEGRVVSLIPLRTKARFVYAGTGPFSVRVLGYNPSLRDPLTQQVVAKPTGDQMTVQFPGLHPTRSYWMKDIHSPTYGGGLI